MAIVGYVCSFAGDLLIKRKVLRVVVVRKMFNSLGKFLLRCFFLPSFMSTIIEDGHFSTFTFNKPCENNL